MYDVNDYGRMMADPARMSAYTEALRRAVKPGSVVVDVGTGTGIFALLAARFGARKVYAIDTNPCIHLAREVAKKNGLADKIEFIQKSVFDVELPEKADVLVADCRGAFTLFGWNLEIMMRARSLVRAGGVIIPERDDLFVAVLEWASYRATIEAPWTAEGFDWTPCREEGMSSRLVAPDVAFEGARFLVEGTRWATVDFNTLASTDVAGHVHARVSRTGDAHFLALWFESTVTDGHVVSSGPPGRPRQVYSPLLLPLASPLTLTEGEEVDTRLNALRSADSYVFAWGLRGSAGSRRQMSEAGAMRTFALNSAMGHGNVRPTR